MTNTTTRTYLVGVIERAIVYFKIKAVDARTAAKNWQDGEFSDSDDEALDSEGPCNVREQQPDGSWRKVPPSEWETTTLSDGEPGKKPYSVLLLYPDYINDSGIETYYALVEASDAIDAVAVAQRQAVAAQEGVDTDADDFAPLLAIEGHHASHPLFNK